MYVIVHTQNLATDSGGTVTAPVVVTSDSFDNAQMQLHQMLASDFAAEAVVSSYVAILGEGGRALVVETCR